MGISVNKKRTLFKNPLKNFHNFLFNSYKLFELLYKDKKTIINAFYGSNILAIKKSPFKAIII